MILFRSLISNFHVMCKAMKTFHFWDLLLVDTLDKYHSWLWCYLLIFSGCCDPVKVGQWHWLDNAICAGCEFVTILWQQAIRPRFSADIRTSSYQIITDSHSHSHYVTHNVQCATNVVNFTRPNETG